MTRTKNETSFKSLSAMVAQSSPESNIDAAPRATSTQQHSVLSATFMQQLKKAPRVDFDFKPNGILTVGMPGDPLSSFDTTAMGQAVVETLITTCLDDKTVIGHDLYTSFALCTGITEDWRPSCSLNLPSIQREFFRTVPMTPGLTAYEQLLAFTGKTTFGDAFDVLFDRDERGDGAFFKVVELMPQTMSHVCAEAINGCDFEDSSSITFAAYLNTDFVKRKASLMSSTKAKLLEFDLYYLPPAHHEFQLAVDSVANALTLARGGL
jgi:hypothetical protein